MTTPPAGRRLLLVVPQFPQLSETFIVTKAVGLLRRGWDVHVVCSASDPDQWRAFGADHAVTELKGRVHMAPDLTPGADLPVRVARSLASLRSAPRPVLRRYLRDTTSPSVRRVRDMVVDATIVGLRPDLVHFEFGSLAVGRLAIGVRTGAAVTVSFRGYDLNYVGLDRPDHYREVWDHAAAVHVLGTDLWRRAVHRGAPPDLPHTVIPPAIDVDAINPAPTRPGPVGTPSNPLRLLSIGRLHWKKGYDHALEAVARLRDRGLQVEHRIVGDGDHLEAVSFWRHQLELDDVVHLLRAVPPAEVARQLAWADVLVHAATSEGFCNAVVEAQAHGVPVVCSDADGLPENVEHRVTGLVVPRRDPAALADGVAALASDGDQRATMGAAGRARVERLFRLDRQLDAWEQFYDDVLDRRASRAATPLVRG